MPNPLDIRHGLTIDNKEIRYEITDEGSKRKLTRHGLTAWAYMTHFDGSAVKRHLFRVHECANSLCTAQWSPSAYGLCPMPTHVKMQIDGEKVPAPLHAASDEKLSDAESVAPTVPDLDFDSLDEINVDPETEAAATCPAASLVESEQSLDPAPYTATVVEEPALISSPVENTATAVEEVQEPAAGKTDDPGAVKVNVKFESKKPDSCVPPPQGATIKGLSVAPAAQATTNAAVAAKSRNVGCGNQGPTHMNTIPDKVLAFAREMQRQRNHVGHAAFVIFAMVRRIRIYVWEGENRIDLLEVLAPWFLEECATGRSTTDAIACAMVRSDEGLAICAPISGDKRQTLQKMGHYVACVQVEGMEPYGEPNTVDRYYSEKGYAVLHTVCDGDCGIDTMCFIIGLPNTVETRTALREVPCRSSIAKVISWSMLAAIEY